MVLGGEALALRKFKNYCVAGIEEQIGDNDKLYVANENGLRVTIEIFPGGE